VCTEDSLQTYSTQKKIYSSYFSEYCIHCKYIDCASDKFTAVLNLVSEIYKPELPATAGPSLAAQITELLSQQQDTTGATAETDLLPQALLLVQVMPQAPEPTAYTDKTISKSANLGNFELRFCRSLDSDDNNFDIDLFL